MRHLTVVLQAFEDDDTTECFAAAIAPLHFVTSQLDLVICGRSSEECVWQRKALELRALLILRGAIHADWTLARLRRYMQAS